MNVETCLRAARINFGAAGLLQGLKAIVAGRFTAEATNGTTLVNISEAGGTTTLAISGDLPPARVLELAVLAHDEVLDNTNWTNPTGYAVNSAWGGQVGVFAGTAGTVTISGTQSFAEQRVHTQG